VLIVENPHVDTVSFYLADSAGVYASFSRGRAFRNNSGKPEYRNPVFRIDSIASAATMAFVRMRTTDVMKSDVSVLRHEDFLRRLQTEHLVFGAYYGAMAVMAIVSVLVFVVLRDPTYAWYALFVALYSLFQASVNGLDAQYLWPAFVWWKARAVPALCGGAVLSGALFSQSFLCVQRMPGRAARTAVTALLAASVVQILLALAGPAPLRGPSGSVLALLFVATMLPLGIVTYARGHTPARYYLLGAAVLFFGIVSNGLKNFGLLPSAAFTEYGNQAGSALGIVFLSGALAYHITVMRRGQRRAEQEAAANERRALEHQRQSAEYRFQALQAKINPHFLFNTLNTVTGLIAGRPREAAEMIAALAKLFRYALTATQKRFVALSEEMEMVTKYLEIEKMRFGERLKYTVIMPQNTGQVAIPALVIQPLVENSIKHGLSPKLDGGEVSVETRLENGLCRVTVSDSGAGFGSGVSGGTGHGLTSVRERMRLAFGGEFTMDIKEHDGVSVEMAFPAKESI
jgi:signal transduction histidine kinase